MSQHADLGHARTEPAEVIRSAVGEEDLSEGRAAEDCAAAQLRLPGTPAWLSWGLSLLLVAGFMAVLSYAYQIVQSSTEAPLLRIVVNGEALELDGQARRDFSLETAGLLDGLEASVAQELQPWLDDKVEAVFSPLDAGVDTYLDWYFSALGSYSRIAVAATSIVDDPGEWIEREMLRRLQVHEAEAALRELEADFAAQLAEVQRLQLQRAQQHLYDQYVGRQATMPEGDDVAIYEVNFDALLAEQLGVQRDLMRLGGAGAGSVGAVVIGQGLARRLATAPALRNARASAARIIARMGLNISRSAATGGALAGAAAPTGPGALIVGSATVVTTFVAAEYAALSFEESRRRPDMEAQLRADVAMAKNEVVESVRALAHEHTASLAGRLKEDLKVIQEANAGGREYRIVDWRWRPGFD